MFPNLNAELARLGWTRKDLANKTGIRYQTLNDKLNGKRPITLVETVKIKNALGLNIPVEEIFLH